MTKNELIKMLTNCGLEANEARAEIELALEIALNKTREELLLDDDSQKYEKILPVIKKRIETGEPIQYILGFAPFAGEKFIVNKNVLIPRDETELLVRQAFLAAKKIKNSPVKILDIGTGSGIIPCTLGKMAKQEGLNAEITGVDISTGALLVAIENMEKMNLKRTVLFRKSDVFSNVRETETFDIIVSNPPYIPESYKKTIQKEVLFEPEIALFTEDEDGLFFYKKIIKEAKKFLNKGGHILFEVMEGKANSIKNLLEKEGFLNIKIYDDMAGISRVVEGEA